MLFSYFFKMGVPFKLFGFFNAILEEEEIVMPLRPRRTLQIGAELEHNALPHVFLIYIDTYL
jgi:hypothetical protein